MVTWDKGSHYKVKKGTRVSCMEGAGDPGEGSTE